MADEIKYFVVTKSYGGITAGLRFKAVMKSSRHRDISLREGLSEETGIPEHKINLSMLGIEEDD